MDSPGTHFDILFPKYLVRTMFELHPPKEKRVVKKVVVACLDDSCRAVLLKLFTTQGLAVQTVRRDIDLLTKIIEEDYDIIFYDLEISNTDGVKIVKILRRIRPKNPLVVISNDSSIELGGKILQENVAYYALKPINPDAIGQALFAVMN